MVLAEGDVLGGYRIVRLIGRGGMGVVYLAEDTRLGRKVALKVLSTEAGEQPSVRDRFLRESQIAASLDHPNILPIFEAGEADGQPFIAMRYVPGLDLDGLIRRDGPLSLARAAALIEQVASALDVAHAAGLIHRDVKPGNILVAPGSQPGSDHAYLSDFGLTKQAEYTAQLTRSGQLMGSVGYIAPEQIENRPIDRRVDVYSLGCVVYECLTGAQPYARDSEMATLYAHVQAPPPSLAEARPELPGTVDAVIAKALAKDPDERYGSAGELARALASAAAPDGADRHLTRGFLFADLRGYTAFVEARGDDAAAGLLEVYRRVVRDVVLRFGGAEIKTEGDSFYVVFRSASDAVRCGLAITVAAATASAEHPDKPIRVGVGIHAGESTETAEGYVGSAVNIAARVCAQAAAGEVLVTDTVRSLTRTSGEIGFTTRGRKHLKGIAEPVVVYAASSTLRDPTGAPPDTRRTSEPVAGLGGDRRRIVAGAGTVGAVALAAILGFGALGGWGPGNSPPASGSTSGSTAAATSGSAGSIAPPASVASAPVDVIVAAVRSVDASADGIDCTNDVGDSRIHEIGTDRSLSQIFPVTHVWQFDPAWSPDGTRIAFAAMDGFGRTTLLVTTPDGLQTVALPGYIDENSNPALPIRPVWSPDGTRIAATDLFGGEVLVWTIAESGPPAVAARLPPRTSGKATPPPPPAGTIYYTGDLTASLAWAPDGTLLLGRERITGAGAPADALPGAGKRNVGMVRWSPDGQLVAIADTAGITGGGPPSQIRVGPPAGPLKVLTSAGNNASPEWSPDGTRLLFVSDRDGRPELYEMKPDGSAQERLTNSPKDAVVCSGSWGRSSQALAAPPATPAPGATPGPIPYQLGALAPGTYLAGSFNPPFQFSIGSGWTGDIEAPDTVELSYGTGGRQARPTIIGLTIQVVYTQPCIFGKTKLVGSTAHDVVAWLQSNPYVKAGSPKPIALGGYSGLVIDVTHPKPVPGAACPNGSGPNPADVWLFPVGGDPGLHMSVGDLARFTIVDVRGQAVLFVFAAPGKLFPAAATQMQPFIDSLTFPTP